MTNAPSAPRAAAAPPPSSGRTLDSPRREDRRVAVATLVGTTIEWYDFFIYAQAAAILLAPLFFEPYVQEHGEVAGRILAFATVGVSFFFRPLGAMVAGHLGDRLGRKAMLVVTLILMGVATAGVGLVPTYDQIGLAAPVIVVLLRILQGFSAGGEWGGAALMAVEHAPARRRGLFGGFPQIGVPLGMLIATAVLGAVTSLTTEAQLHAWGWRLPFLFSIVLIAVGMAIRLGVAESPVFKEIASSKEQVRLPLLDMFRFNGKQLVQGALIFMGNGVAGYMITGGYILAYASASPEAGGLGLERASLLGLSSLCGVTWAATTLGSAMLSDRITRTRVYKIGFVLQLLWVFPLFWLVDTTSLPLIALGMLVLTIPLGMTYGPQAAMFAEMFPARVRYSGAGLAYAIGSILGGAFAPMIATFLQDRFGTSAAVSAYLFLFTLIALIATFTVKDRTASPLGADAPIEGGEEIEEALSQHKTRPTPARIDGGAGY